MTVLHASAKLVKGYRIAVDDGEAHSMCVDLEPPLGGGMGPSALELALMSFVGCYATIFVMTAKKMRLPVRNLEVNTEAVKSEEIGTITQVKCDVIVESDASGDRIERAHQLTVEGCPVGILFEKAGVKIDYQLKIEKKQA